MNAGAVLVVEDEAMILLDLESALQEAGFEVVCAKSSAEAIAAFDLEPDHFIALISDVRLGPGISGWQVARHLRKARPMMPVIFVSGDSAGDWHAEGVPNSIMISKPFVHPQIITAISTLLNKQITDSNIDTTL
jgi:two-component system OmpR family response regulator